VHEHNAGSLKAQVSKLRQIGLAAAKPTCDFPATLAKLSIVHQEMQAKAKETGIKPRSTYNAQTEAARTQTKQDDDLTDEQILAICRKPDPKDKTELGEVERAEKILDGLVSGESGLGPCQTPEVIAGLWRWDSYPIRPRCPPPRWRPRKPRNPPRGNSCGNGWCTCLPPDGCTSQTFRALARNYRGNTMTQRQTKYFTVWDGTPDGYAFEGFLEELTKAMDTIPEEYRERHCWRVGQWLDGNSVYSPRD
jgi:hypothetical protein